MRITGKEGYIPYHGKTIRFLNQRSEEWTHLYEYPADPGSNMHNAACGIFSVCFAAEKMTGKRIDAEELADFSCLEGGRGDDGTDRPALLTALEKHARSREYGFRYDGLGLQNDHDKLWDVLKSGGCALCNLRPGHIVCLVEAREVNGEKQVLVIDSYSESADKRITDQVREVIPESQVVSLIRNDSGLVTGYQISHGMFWVPLTLPRNFNLLYPIENQ